MGCSASSRLDTIVSKTIEVEDPSLYFSSKTCLSTSSLSLSLTSSNMVPKSKSLSAPMVHHPPLCKGDSNHLVSLTSSTYGSLVIVDSDEISSATAGEFSGEFMSPDSVINTWELMEGLEDDDAHDGVCDEGLQVGSLNYCYFDVGEKNGVNSCGFSDIKKKPILKMESLCDLSDDEEKPSLKMGSLCDFSDDEKKPSLKMGSSCDFSDDKEKPNLKMRGLCDLSDDKEKLSLRLGLDLSDSYVFVEMPRVMEAVERRSNSKPLWKRLSEESMVSKMEGNVGSRRAASVRELGCDQPIRVSKSVGSVPFGTKSKSVGWSPVVSSLCRDDACSRVSGFEDKIVLYFTSLRGIRRTYEDCSSVRMILRGFRVMVDERDISMDSNYKKELQSALGGKGVSLPQLFIRGRNIGGADEIKQLHENGELEGLLDGFPIQDRGVVCERCGESRFVLCSNCNGSRKVFQEEEGQTRRCNDCNENGLVRCPVCCS